MQTVPHTKTLGISLLMQRSPVYLVTQAVAKVVIKLVFQAHFMHGTAIRGPIPLRHGHVGLALVGVHQLPSQPTTVFQSIQRRRNVLLRIQRHL